MDAIMALKTRRSVRTYERLPVPREIIEDVIDCGRLAASANNVQPWEFVVVTEAGMRRRLADIAEYGKFIAEALSASSSSAGIPSTTWKTAAPPRRICCWRRGRGAWDHAGWPATRSPTPARSATCWGA